MTAKGNAYLMAEVRKYAEKLVDAIEVNERLLATITYYKNREDNLKQKSFYKAFRAFLKLRK